ncbi:MAG: LEA type 2 family protein [Gemmatimonadota bacterium]
MKRDNAWAPARAAVMALLVAGMVACVPRMQRPEVRLVSVHVTSFGLTGGSVQVRLSVYNPNTFALDAKGLSYNVELAQDSSDENWISLADGTFDQAVRVGAADSTQVDIPVEFTYKGLGGAFRALLRRGTFDYRIHGDVNVQTPIRARIPYSHKGMVSMSGAT